MSCLFMMAAAGPGGFGQGQWAPYWTTMAFWHILSLPSNASLFDALAEEDHIHT